MPIGYRHGLHVGSLLVDELLRRLLIFCTHVRLGMLMEPTPLDDTSMQPSGRPTGGPFYFYCSISPCIAFLSFLCCFEKLTLAAGCTQSTWLADADDTSDMVMPAGPPVKWTTDHALITIAALLQSITTTTSVALVGALQPRDSRKHIVIAVFVACRGKQAGSRKSQLPSFSAGHPSSSKTVC